MPQIFVVATPIGNLEDISLRALKVLKEVDIILCENPERTLKLLNFYQIKKPLLRYHQHSRLKSENKILDFLKKGKKLALVSDSGTPGISDPGGKLIEKITKELGDLVKIIPIPGPCAICAGASVSGFFMDKFLFLGFPPKKKKRKKFFEEASKASYPVIFYESPHRILKTLKELSNFNKELNVVVCRELTKMFETIYRGRIDEVINKIEKEKIKGEFVVIVKK